MKQYKGIIITTLVIFGFIALMTYSNKRPGNYDSFASCLTEQGVSFFGAFWCPYCERTKVEFGNSFKKLDAYECSTPQRQQTKVCKDAGIESYPTWRFKDGSKKTGALSFAQLSEITGCAIDPQTDSNPEAGQDSVSE